MTHVQTDQFRWGILAPGKIARRFATGLAVLPNHHIAAVASRSKERAQAFSDDFPAENIYDSYDALLADDSIDCIYVSSPHTFHKEHASMAVKAGKNVLCEKPICINSQELEELLSLAQQNNVFIMEGMWTRCFPVIQQVKKWLNESAIGEIKQMRASFGFAGPTDPQHRLMNPKLAGGSLLDVGIYPVAMAHYIFGEEPQRIAATATMSPSGVDEQCAMLFSYENGAIAMLDSAVRCNNEHGLWLFGEKGNIRIEAPFWCPTKAILTSGDETITFEKAHRASGFEYEAEEVERCVRAGLKESPHVSHNDSRAVMRSLDQVRAQIELRYPGE